jgi:LAO/AO transport system kinase
MSGGRADSRDPRMPEDLARELREGSRQALARAITLIESTRADHRAEAAVLLGHLAPWTGGSIRIGISGAPGVGKSTLIEALGGRLIDGGHRLAVLSVDPSSSLSGGSILGDKTRMETLARRPEAFIRPSPAGTTLGGVARRTREALLACEAAGYDVVIVETVGVGQSETAVAEMTDVFVLLLQPGSGDELQGLKRGIFELADIVVVNKADGELERAAEQAAAEARSALSLARPRRKGWEVQVLLSSAVRGRGVEALWERILHFRKLTGESGEFDAMRADQARSWMWAETAESLLTSLKVHPGVRGSVPELEEVVRAGELAPPSAARRLLDIFLAAESPPRDPSAVGRVNHIAVVVPDLEAAGALYRDALGASVSEKRSLPEHGVEAVFVELPNTKIELLRPLDEASPVGGFLAKHPVGGIHHICFQVEEIAAAAARLTAAGARILGDGRPKTGAHGRPVLFLHPKDFFGTLIELEEK